MNDQEQKPQLTLCPDCKSAWIDKKKFVACYWCFLKARAVEQRQEMEERR